MSSGRSTDSLLRTTCRHENLSHTLQARQRERSCSDHLSKSVSSPSTGDEGADFAGQCQYENRWGGSLVRTVEAENPIW